MTTTTQTTATRTCPPSDVADQILPWGDVKPGDLVLWDGELVPVTRNDPYKGTPGLRLIGLAGDVMSGCIPAGRYAAVRRYTEGTVTLTAGKAALAAAGLDEAARDREEQAGYWRQEGDAGEEQEHAERAAEYRALRDELEAADLPDPVHGHDVFSRIEASTHE